MCGGLVPEPTQSGLGLWGAGNYGSSQKSSQCREDAERARVWGVPEQSLLGPGAASHAEQLSGGSPASVIPGTLCGRSECPLLHSLPARNPSLGPPVRTQVPGELPPPPSTPLALRTRTYSVWPLSASAHALRCSELGPGLSACGSHSVLQASVWARSFPGSSAKTRQPSSPWPQLGAPALVIAPRRAGSVHLLPPQRTP